MFHNFISKTKIPRKLPPGMQGIVDRLKNSTSQQQCLANAHKAMANRFHGRHFMTYFKPLPIFSMDAEKLWNSPGFMHCHNINWLLRIILVKSGFFKNGNIQNRWTLVWYCSPHQYLQIRMNKGKTINVDVWGVDSGVKLGNYAHGFK